MAAESESRPELGVGQSRPILLELRVWAGIAKILPTPTPAKSRRLQPSKDDAFGQAVMHHPDNTGRQEEKESGSVEIKVQRHLVIDVRLISGIGDNSRVIAIVV